MREETDMPIMLEKARVNMWNVVGFVVGIAVTAFGWGVTYNSVVSANAAASAEINKLSDDVKEIQKQIPQIAQLQFQVTANASQIASNKTAADEQNKATNARMDRFVETLGGKVDLVVDTMNKLVTRVEVLSTRIGENSGTDAKRTRFLTLPLSKP